MQTQTQPKTAQYADAGNGDAASAQQTLIERIIAETRQEVRGVDDTADAYCAALSEPTLRRAERSIVQAKGIRALREKLSGETFDLLSGQLMNHKLGFLTDRDPNKPGKDGVKQPYPKEVVRDCMIEALLRGVHLDGNEFNIIASSCYITLEGCKRKVREFPGVENPEWDCGPPYLDKESGRICCLFSCEWTYNGQRMHLKNRKGEAGQIIAQKVEERGGVDFYLGKATRKGLARVFDVLRGLNPNVPGLEAEREAEEELARQLTSEPVAKPKPRVPPANMPQTAVELTQRISRIDLNPPRSNLWKSGELQAFVAASAEAHGLPPALIDWMPEQFPEAVRIVEHYIALCEQVDDGTALTGIAATQLLRTINASEWGWLDALKFLGLHEDTRIIDLTAQQAHAVVEELEKPQSGVNDDCPF
jgi:hypothetical protein